MHIPSYQINNVLKVYSKQVSQSRILKRQKGIGQESSVDRISISNEGKRKVIIDRVTAGIVDKISRFDPQAPNAPAGAFPAEGEVGLPTMKNEKDFIYNVIDDQNNKKTNTLSIDNSGFVTQQVTKPADPEG